MIKIVSKKNGFMRCGVKHADKPVDYPNGTFTEEQIERLKKEPMLIVLELPDPAPNTGQDIDQTEGDPGEKQGKKKGK